MKKLSHLLLVVMVLSSFSIFVACNSDKKKLEDKERELSELRQLAELDKKEMENQYAEFASQYGELKKGVKDDSLVNLLKSGASPLQRLCSKSCKIPRPVARLKSCA